MKLPKLAIENHHFTIVVFIMLSLFGITSFIAMPRSEDPPVSPPGVSISIIYPGASPSDLESLVVDPVEEALNELEDIKTLSSHTTDGAALIDIEFEAGSDDAEKYSDVVQKVNGVRNELPDDIYSIDMVKWSTTDVAILQLALASESAPFAEMEHEAKRLKRRLERIAGVRKVEVMAFPERQVRVDLDFERMSRLGVTLRDVIGAVQASNANIPGGNVDIGPKQFTIRTTGSFESVDAIGKTIIHARGGHPVYLREFADVHLSYRDESYRGRLDGRRALFITVTQKESANIFRVFDRMVPTIEEFSHGLPDTMSIEYAFNQSESVSKRVNGFFFNLMQGLVVVGVIVLLGVGGRASLIVMTAIPLSFLIALGLAHLTGYGLQQMSIVGLVIALGLLVDNAIVVTENTSRFMNRGLGGREAAVRGTSQIGWAVVSATVTTVLAFFPIVLMRNETGDFIRSMPVTVIYALMASLLIALTLTPYLSSVFLRPNGGEKHPIKERIGESLRSLFGRMLDFALRRRLVAVLLTVAVFAAVMGLFPRLGMSLFPKAEKPQFIVNVNTPEGTSLDRTDQISRKVEGILLAREEVKHVVTNVGRGNPRIYYNVISLGEKSNHAQLLVQLKEYDREKMQRLLSELRDTFDGIPGATIEVKELLQGPPVEAPIAIKVIGDDLDVLKDLSADVESVLDSEEGAVNVSNPLKTNETDLHVRVHRDKAAMLQVPLAEIDRTVRAGMTGIAVSTYRNEAGDEQDIVLRLPVKNRPSVSDFGRIYVGSRTGTMVPLSQLASLEFQSSPTSISHYNLERVVTVTADVTGPRSVDEVTRSVMKKLDAYPWPRGYRYYAAGEIESREESFGGLQQAFVLALIAIFAVLVLQFRSYTQPLIVFAAIPLAVVGSVLALFLTGNPFSFSAFVGLTGLIGIVINNSILLVEYANQLRGEGMDRFEAVRKAAGVRFKPIMLTTCTTVGGLLPLTLRGGTLWAPFGWTIIGGLVTSTVLTLVVVPVLYTFFSRDGGSIRREA